MLTTTISKLQVGQRFSFIPSEWYGQCKLTEKSDRSPRDGREFFDIKYRANVVNPPGVIYGISGDTKVRLLSNKPRRQSKGSSGGFIV